MNQNTAPSKLFFVSDYMEGAHPLILQRLMETNLLHTAAAQRFLADGPGRAAVVLDAFDPDVPGPTSVSVLKGPLE